MSKPKVCWTCLSEHLKPIKAQGLEWWRCQKCGSMVLK